MKYDFRCGGCSGLIFETTTPAPQACPMGHDSSVLQRVFRAPALHKEMPGQYSQAVGRYVANKRDFKSALSQASDEASENTGMEHRYRPIDMADLDATRKTEE